MIRIFRVREPSSLKTVRRRKLKNLRQKEKDKNPFEDNDFEGYRDVAEDLWQMQHEKCCYCEKKVGLRYFDVEHLRSKKRTDRSPGCAETYGYYWLTWTWKNLLFACQLCNRTNKNDCFPLAVGSVALRPWEKPPGRERPLLLDPSVAHGVTYIKFIPWAASPNPPHEMSWSEVSRWEAKPRLSDMRCQPSIDIFGLNHRELRDTYLNHVRDMVWGYVEAIRKAIRDKDHARVREEVTRAKNQLLVRSVPFVGLSYDALRFFVPPALIKPSRAAWPPPEKVGHPPPRG